jgi:hypothetical protein
MPELGWLAKSETGFSVSFLLLALCPHQRLSSTTSCPALISKRDVLGYGMLLLPFHCCKIGCTGREGIS